MNAISDSERLQRWIHDGDDGNYLLQAGLAWIRRYARLRCNRTRMRQVIRNDLWGWMQGAYDANSLLVASIGRFTGMDAMR